MSVTGDAGQAAIFVHAVAKRYRLGRQRLRYATLRETLVASARGAMHDLGGRLRARPATPEPTIWALRDASLAIGRGEVVGLVGGNGAGKSTLLKILSRVTAPTAGYVELRGRVGSLLEVGTGFHPELTGRENVYLNGAVLGMRRAEIARKFDEIVDFAEVDQFLDTPVKRYSSGMYMRLAFAVAAHLEPEILVVDEVLAVGDATFQRKCLGKMDEVAHEGRTVLFVSHNMDAVRRLCPRTVLLERGTVVADGPTADVIGQYLSRTLDEAGPNRWIDVSGARRRGSGAVRFAAVRYRSGEPRAADHAYLDGPLEFELRLVSDADRTVESLAVTLYDRFGVKLVNADTISLGERLALRAGENTVTLRIEEVHLNPGLYHVGLWLADSVGAVYDHAESAFAIDLVAFETGGFGVTPVSNGAVSCRFSVEGARPA